MSVVRCCRPVDELQRQADVHGGDGADREFLSGRLNESRGNTEAAIKGYEATVSGTVVTLVRTQLRSVLVPDIDVNASIAVRR